MQLFLKCVSVPLPGVADRSEFALDYSLQLDIVICLCASMEKRVYTWLVLESVHFSHVTLNPQSISCLLL